MEFLVYLFYIWLLCIISILTVFAHDILALWREPVLSYPVMIVESDDWGAGPLSQAPALTRLVKILNSHIDRRGRHPVMTIAIILAIPDGLKIESSGEYHRIILDHRDFEPIIQALNDGVRDGVFSPQLHGLEHYWPPTLMKSDNSDVQAWLRQGQPQSTEALPSHVQSRWINAVSLPSSPLATADIATAMQEETAVYSRVTGQPALVAVPPTFVWDDEVERCWAKHGVEFVVTPGRRYGCRGNQGEPACTGDVLRNGDSGCGVTYLVRNDYFEPEKGHDANYALAAMTKKVKQGRPCLLETHRSNFIGEDSDNAYAELDSLMQQAQGCFPDLRYMDTLELGRAIRDGSCDLIEREWQRRISPWVARLEQLSHFDKLARLIGLKPVLNLIVFLLSLLLQPRLAGTLLR